MADLFDIVTARKLSGGGGGGSSDFSTAEVTITNNSADYIELDLCYGYNDVVRGNTVEAGVKLDENDSITVDAILYKGNFGTIAPMLNITCTGGATYNNGVLKITGDCTITIS